MGSQGEIYVVYGLLTEAEVLYEPGKDKNPVVYGVNGRAFSDDEDNLPVLERLTHLEVSYAGIHCEGYGALDPMKQDLSVRPLGHSGEHSGNMGSRHFLNAEGGGKALVGYAVSNAAYMNGSEPVASMDKIKEAGPKLVTEIKETLGLDVTESELGLHLVFDWLQGY